MFETVIAKGAAQWGSRIAIKVGDRSAYTYALMATDIRKCAAWLGRRRMKPGSRVVLHMSDPYLHWVLFFAIEAHGLIAVPETLHVRLDAERLAFLGADAVFSDLASPGMAGISWVQTGPAWKTVFRGFRPLPLPARQRRPEDPACIILSSGTTGTAKKVLLTHRVLDSRLSRDAEGTYLRHSAHAICLVPFQSIGGLLAAMRLWQTGGTLAFHVTGTPWRQTFAEGGFDTILGAPVHLQQILRELPDDVAPPPGLTIIAGGSVLSKALRAEIGARLTEDVQTAYGTTETGVVTRAEPGFGHDGVESAGMVRDWVEVSIAGADGRDAPTGETGEIRIRGDDVVDGYLDDPKETARSFRDGWYYPGDLGFFNADGVLTVSGRVDDLMNFGGRKSLPSVVESAVLRIEGIADAAAFPAADPQSGELVLWIAYVARRPIDSARFAPALANFPVTRVVRVASIPRNPMGKIERPLLRREAEDGSLRERLAA